MMGRRRCFSVQVELYERARFFVHSHGQTLTVDLLCYSGNGCCDCAHFLSRLKPEIERLMQSRQFKPGPEYKCPHITAADAVLLGMFKQQLLKQFPDNSIET
jgi:hypothetical protein